MSRKSGYYWVKEYRDSSWEIAEYNSNDKTWQLIGDEEVYNDYTLHFPLFYEIAPNPIVRDNIPDITVLLDGVHVGYSYDNKTNTITLNIPEELL